MVAEARLEQCRTLVDKRLEHWLPPVTDVPAKLHEAMRYSALAPGKRIRPALCMASCASVGADPEAALDAGCALELIHCFSLIHDDLPAIDDDDLRRGRPTCHVQFGEALAVLAGDALFALAFEVASHCSPDPVVLTSVVRTLANATGSQGLVGGEVLDVEAEGGDGSMEDLVTIHKRKTGSLIAASCLIGGVLGGADAAQQKALAIFGEKVGLAFQVADDVLNVTSTAVELGKAAGSDEKKNKLTYPAFVGLEASRAESQRLLTEAIETVRVLPDPDQLVELAEYCVARTR